MDLVLQTFHEKSLAVRRFPRGVGRRRVEKIPILLPSFHAIRELQTRFFSDVRLSGKWRYSIDSFDIWAKRWTNLDGYVWRIERENCINETVTTKTSTTSPFFLLSLRRIPRDSDHSRGLYLSPRVEIAALSTKRNKSDTIKNSNVGAK